MKIFTLRPYGKKRINEVNKIVIVFLLFILTLAFSKSNAQMNFDHSGQLGNIKYIFVTKSSLGYDEITPSDEYIISEVKGLIPDIIFKAGDIDSNCLVFLDYNINNKIGYLFGVVTLKCIRGIKISDTNKSYRMPVWNTEEFFILDNELPSNQLSREFSNITIRLLRNFALEYYKANH